MEVMTAELEGVALDWAIAKAEGWQPVYTDGSITPVFQKRGPVAELNTLNYSSDPSKLHPIIKREGISTFRLSSTPKDAMAPLGPCWGANNDGTYQAYGLTSMEAASRCFVASKLGNLVDVPDELILQPARRMKP